MRTSATWWWGECDWARSVRVRWVGTLVSAALASAVIGFDWWPRGPGWLTGWGCSSRTFEAARPRGVSWRWLRGDAWRPLSCRSKAPQAVWGLEMQKSIGGLSSPPVAPDIQESNTVDLFAARLPLCRTALAGLFPDIDSLLRCWWDSARHSTSLKRVLRAIEGWAGSSVIFK